MGLYQMNCTLCGDMFQWFSGADNMHCPQCQKADARDMSSVDIVLEKHQRSIT
jgi:LSD1 subclass zinc finger protein